MAYFLKGIFSKGTLAVGRGPEDPNPIGWYKVFVHKIELLNDLEADEN